MTVVINGTTGITSPGGDTSTSLTTTTITATTENITNLTTSTLSLGGNTLGAGNASIMKNRIINGAMLLNQRGFSGAVTATSFPWTYTLDRWIALTTQASKITISQNAGSITPPIGFKNYLGCTSSSAYSIGSGDNFSVQQRVEGFNISDLGWGTANAKTVTLSFQVYSSLTGTFGGAIGNGNDTRSYPFSYSIPIANTWTTISITITGDTTGTWATDNGIGLITNFSLGTGSTLSNIAGSWTAGVYVSATGAVSVVGTSGATFYITGVQLEVGASSTGYEYRQYGQELALCQRYAQKWMGSGTGTQGIIAIGQNNAVATAAAGLQPIVPLRTTPTITFSSLIWSDSTTYDLPVTVISVAGLSVLGLYLDITHNTGASTNRPGNLRPGSNTSGYLLLSSEL